MTTEPGELRGSGRTRAQLNEALDLAEEGKSVLFVGMHQRFISYLLDFTEHLADQRPRVFVVSRAAGIVAPRTGPGLVQFVSAEWDHFDGLRGLHGDKVILDHACTRAHRRHLIAELPWHLARLVEAEVCAPPTTSK